jgi:hypothetical protein
MPPGIFLQIVIRSAPAKARETARNRDRKRYQI